MTTLIKTDISAISDDISGVKQDTNPDKNSDVIPDDGNN
jgi:hypothetical protein